MSFIQEMQEARKNTASYTINLSDITPVNKEEIKVSGTLIPITAAAFKDLLNIAGITNAMLLHLNETINPSAGFQLIKELTKAIAARKGKSTKLILIVDLETKNITRIAFDLYQTSSIPPTAIEELLNSIGSNSKISLKSPLITDSGTKVTFNINYNVEIPLKMSGESISFGKQITWDMFSDLRVVDLIERLVCTNGMTAIVPGDTPTILNTSSSPSEWYQTLYRELMNPNKDTIDHYESKVLEAMQSNLSVYEYNKIKAHALIHWRDDVDRIIRAIGDDKEWKIKYEKQGIDLEKCTSAQLRNCPTPVNAWDAVNMLTDLASHTYNSIVSARVIKDTQRLAGKILNANWDENSWMSNLPKFDLKRKI